MKSIANLLFLTAFMGLCGGVGAEPSALDAVTLTYKSVEGIELEADVYGGDSKASRPVLLWLHGGALIVGNRSRVPPDLLALCQQDDFVLVSVDYRLAPEAGLDAVLSDVTDAVAWIRERGPELFGADPSRLAVAGVSAGGYLTLALGHLAQPAPLALVSYWGYGSLEWYLEPSSYYLENAPLRDPEEIRERMGSTVLPHTTGDTVRPRWNYYVHLRQAGRWAQEVAKVATAEDLERYSPALQARRDFPPTLLVHGTDDQDVPFEQAQNMATTLSGLGVQNRLIAVPGAGHGLDEGDEKDVERARFAAREFIRKHLLGRR